MGGEQLVGHRRPGRRLGRRRSRAERLDQVLAVRSGRRRRGCRARPDGRRRPRPRRARPLQRRELLGPAVVARRVEAEVDDVGSCGDPGGEVRIGGVAGEHGCSREHAVAAAVHGDDVDAALDELLDDEAADLAGAEDDVAGHARGSFRAVEREGEDDGQGGDDDCAARSEDGELLLDLDADCGGDRPSEGPDHGQHRRPGEGERPLSARRTSACPIPTATPQMAPWTARADVGPVVDGGGANGEADRQTDRGGEDPRAGRGRRRPNPQDCTAPSTAPLTAPPSAAAPTLSIGPATAGRRGRRSGSPRR